MKAVILAGGYGTRISEESQIKPKPMIEIGGKPLLWHVMKIFSKYGINDFIICLGYKGYMIKEYFANYYLHESDVTFDFSKGNQCEIHTHKAEPWRVTLVNTGVDTMTGGRVKRIESYVKNETFFLTYGDGVSDVNINELLNFHKKHGKSITVTAVQPPGRFGSLNIDNKNLVTNFMEKPVGDGNWINGGFFVMGPEIFKHIKDDKSILERYPMETIAKDGNLCAYKHKGFWSAVDTLRDKLHLEDLWTKGNPPWKVWD